MKTLVLFFTMISLSVGQQHRVILHIDEKGIQDIIPIAPGESVVNALTRHEQSGDSRQTASILDTIRHFSSENELLSNFGFLAQEVALQWFTGQTDGEVTELGWRNYEKTGAVKKAKIRAWYLDPRVAEFPAARYDVSGGMGFYAAKNSLPIAATPFKDEAQETVFRSLNAPDSAYVTFDPLGQEAAWKPGGIVVDLTSNQWQSFKISNTGSSFPVKYGQLFGFTLQNISLPTDSAIRLELSSKVVEAPSNGTHFSTTHSLKFHQSSNPTYSKPGWYVRQFDYGMYVVVSYVSTDNPYYTVGYLGYNSSVSQGMTRTVSARIKNNATGLFVPPSEINKLELHYKIGNAIGFETAPTTISADTFKSTLPGLAQGQTMYFYLSGSSTHGARIVTNVSTISQPTAVLDERAIPQQSHIKQNYPNPFNPSTRIEYDLSGSGNVTLNIYDVLGREMKQLVNERKEAGTYSVVWDASSHAAGIYFARMSFEKYTSAKKLVLVK